MAYGQDFCKKNAPRANFFVKNAPQAKLQDLFD